MRKILLLIFPVFFLLSCNHSSATVVDNYEISKLNIDFGENEAYEIGANTDGMPIFKNTDKALEQAQIDYQEGLRAIAMEFDLEPISNSNINDYKKFGWQITVKDKHVSQQGIEISKFLDIYENSFK
ncbi:hypothetical protein [Lysinibacillus sp. 38-6]|uniref:hypothetical protein n=1 Tax=Lysinibacillus sp. 38-6 TaxID=3385991 RepID=UPI0039088B5B